MEHYSKGASNDWVLNAEVFTVTAPFEVANTTCKISLSTIKVNLYVFALIRAISLTFYIASPVKTLSFYE